MLKIFWPSSLMDCTRIWTRTHLKLSYVNSLQTRNIGGKECHWLKSQILNGVDTSTIRIVFLWSYFKGSLLAASNAPYFDAVTKALQELFGYLHGILADRTIKVEELRSLMDLSVEISLPHGSHGLKLTQCIDAFVKEEILEGEDAWYEFCSSLLTHMAGTVQHANGASVRQSNWELGAYQTFLSSI